jgi:electron transfer flavoprotein beta subunit
MEYRIVVLAKQVPDTKKITGKAMKPDGTVNRRALPAIFNPEDLNALEAALEVKERYGAFVTLVTMGPPSASQILRDALYRGADEGVLITDRRAAASDTLATSYILSCAVRKCSPVDMVICGRQAIDGDTAQVGPQTAEKLNLPQMTYVQSIESLADTTITARRMRDDGVETARCPLPALLTVMDVANQPRPVSIKRLMKYKSARTPAEILEEVKGQSPEAAEEELKRLANERTKELHEQGLLLKQWNLDDIGADIERCGKSGSPTRVKRIQNIVLTATERKNIPATDEGISALVHELIEDHTIG